jgi:hypothetical protein
MDSHPPNRGSGIVESDLPQWRKARVGAVMIQKSSASSSYSHVRVGQTPDHSSDSSLTCRGQSGLCRPGRVPVSITQLLYQDL